MACSGFCTRLQVACKPGLPSRNVPTRWYGPVDGCSERGSAHSGLWALPCDTADAAGQYQPAGRGFRAAHGGVAVR